jgi:hypothetical protein
MGYDNNFRQKANSLGAVDARSLVSSTFPFLVTRMTPHQIQQLQKVLDAAVVNPALEKEYEDLMRKSVRSQSGAFVHRDPTIVARANRVMGQRYYATDGDKRVRLNYNALLTADALAPVTGNPDERAYLNKVRSILDSRGVWLRIGKKLISQHERVMAERQGTGPQVWEVWLSLGENGDRIPTVDGQLTRKALLGTTMLGAGYWDDVHQGSVQTILKNQIDRLEQQIRAGEREHDRLIARKDDAAFGVAEVSDFLGGADLPERSMWEHPRSLLLKALKLRADDNLTGSASLLVLAAVATRNCAAAIAEYKDDSVAGAGRAVAILEVAKTAGEIAEIGLAVTGAGAVVRGGVRKAGGTQIREKLDDATLRRLAQNGKQLGITDAEAAAASYVPQPNSTKLGSGRRPGQSSGVGGGKLSKGGYRL